MDGLSSIPSKALCCRSELEAVPHLCRDHARVVEVEASYGDAVVLQDAVIGDVYAADREGEAFAEVVSEG